MDTSNLDKSSRRVRAGRANRHLAVVDGRMLTLSAVRRVFGLWYILRLRHEVQASAWRALVG
jgi:hypothetical protein